MKRVRTAVMLILVLILILPTGALAATPSDWSASAPESLEADHLYAASAVLTDLDTQTVLFSKDSRVRMHPASTTKIMTILLGIESSIGLDTVITIPQSAADIPKSSSLVPVNPGEQMTFRDLLYGTMLASGNDGANAIAELVGGSVSAFVDLMNQRAYEIGCEGTHFSNAHGFTADDHYTTAMDLARITMTALQNETFRQIVATQSYTMDISGRGAVVIQNRAVMLNPSSPYYYADCIGVKTGYTNAAGQCFVGAADLNGRIVVSVVLGTDPKDENLKWKDTIKLFEYARTRYQTYSLTSLIGMVPSLSTVSIQNALAEDPEGGSLTLNMAQLSDSSYFLMTLRDNSDDMTRMINNFASRSSIQITDDLTAPVTEGEIIGTYSYSDPSGENISAYLVASRSVEMEPEKLKLEDVIPFVKNFSDESFRKWVIIAACIVIFLLLIRRIRRIRRNRRRRRIYENRRKAEMRRREMQKYPRR